MKPTCPYCDKPCKLVGALAIYDRNYGGKYWLCEPCKAHVGCHPGTERPLGTPAKAGLRGLRRTLHNDYLDPLWNGGGMSRKQAYKWLASAMGKHVDDCHVGWFDENECYKAMRLIVELSEQRKAAV